LRQVRAWGAKAAKAMRGATGWAGHGLLVILVAGIMAGCGKGAATTMTAGGATATGTASVKIAAKPVGGVPAGAACVTAECHVRYGTGAGGAAQLHGPVAAGACFACHGSDVGGHAYPLVRSGNEVCTFCHAVVGTKSHQHAATTQPAKPGAAAVDAKGGGCLNCHDAHASRTKFLLTADSVEMVCAKCHDEPLKRYAHVPFVAGQCTVCHQPHQADNVALLRGGDGKGGPEHCFSCHKDKQEALAKDSHVHAPAKENCTTCHGPHATEYPYQLKKPLNETCLDAKCHAKVREELAKASVVHGAVATAEGCANCHDPHASNQPAVLKARADKVCLTCHDKDVKAADGRMLASMKGPLASTNLHGPVKTGSCSECHSPHAGGTYPNLLKANAPKGFYSYAAFNVADYALCFGCHDKQLVLQPKTTALTSFRNGDENLHFVHVNRAEKGRTCKTCHEVHGSDLPKHMASTVGFEGSGWAMPINYVQTAEGGSCAPGCHKEREYKRSGGAETRNAKVETRNGEEMVEGTEALRHKGTEGVGVGTGVPTTARNEK